MQKDKLNYSIFRFDVTSFNHNHTIFFLVIRVDKVIAIKAYEYNFDMMIL